MEVGTLIDSGAVGVEKPDPRIFHLALDALDADPARTAYVGDMPRFDVVGANRAGLRPLLMDPYGFQHRIDVRAAHVARRRAAPARRRRSALALAPTS